MPRAAACADTPVVVQFREALSPEQQVWLRKTRIRVRRVAFRQDDQASAELLHDASMLVSLRGHMALLQEL